MSARTSTRWNDRIEYSFWLVFGEDGTMRFTRTEPNAGRGERKMKAAAVLPRSLFKTPELKLTIGVADPGNDAFTIDIQAASEALRATLGVDVDLRIESPE